MSGTRRRVPAGSGSVVFLTLGPDVEQSFEGKSLHDVKRTLDCIHSNLYLLCYEFYVVSGLYTQHRAGRRGIS